MYMVYGYGFDYLQFIIIAFNRATICYQIPTGSSTFPATTITPIECTNVIVAQLSKLQIEMVIVVFVKKNKKLDS